MNSGKKAAVALLTLITGTTLSGQGVITLIGTSARNGSFENAVLSPWTTAAGSTSILEDPTFATNGRWYAALSDTSDSLIVRPSIFHRLNADRSEGLNFSLEFDARNGVAPFVGIRVFFAAQNSDSSYVFATNSFFNLPPNQWQASQLEFRVPNTWDGGGLLSLGFQFERLDATPGTPYVGYLDNVILQQVPEPTSGVLFLCGLMAASYASWPRAVKE